MYWETLYHATNIPGLKGILEAHEIKYDSKHVEETKDIAFLSFMSSDVKFPREKLVWHYRSNPIIFGIDTSILRKQEFVLCDDMYMGLCVVYPKHAVIDTRGTGKKKFSTKTITDHINKRADPENIYNVSFFKLMMYKYDKLKELSEIIEQIEYENSGLTQDVVEEYVFWSKASEPQLRERYLSDMLSEESMYFGRTHEILISGGVPEKYWNFILIPERMKHLVSDFNFPEHVEIRYYTREQYWDYKTMLKP